MPLKSHTFGTNAFPSTYEVTKSETLQLTDMCGGSNKYYLGELHKSGCQYRIYTSYGRTGAAYAAKEERFPERSNAESEFDALIKSKIKKGYRKVEMAATSQGTDVGNTRILSTDVKLTPTVTKNSVSLEASIVNLVTRLYNAAGQSCQSQLQGSLQTSAKNPLGTLTQGQIAAGKQVLYDVNQYLAANKHLINSVDPKIVKFSNEFYSAIPQNIPLRPKDEGSRVSWLAQHCLNRPAILDEKSDLLDLLGDVKGMIQGFDSTDIGVKYQQLNCDIRPATSAEHTYAKQYMEGSQSSRHSWSVRLLEVWSVINKNQFVNDPILQETGNVQELFHGSRAANILGICKSGLLLRPPGAYVTGSMFGNGLYFADKSTKSSQYATADYSYSSRRTDNSAFMFIAQVALGKIKEYQDAQTHLREAPAGHHSVKGCAGRSLVHNEYIIYRIKQHKLKFLCRFEQT